MNKRTMVLFALGAMAACGGDADEAAVDTQPAEAPAPAQPAQAQMGEMSMPEWFQADEAANTVNMTVTTGMTSAKNYWNFNGGHDGNMTITVPVGATVTIDLVNNDPAMPHSLGIESYTSNFPAAPTPNPVFEGAVSPNPTSMTEGTMPGQSATVTFVADQAGEYSMVCYIPGHLATGMYVFFNVSADGQAGVQTAM